MPHMKVWAELNCVLLSPTYFVCADTIRARFLSSTVATLNVVRRLDENDITSFDDGTFAGLSEMTSL